MSVQKSYSLDEVFNGAVLGFVFEFYSSKGTEFIVDELSFQTGKSVSLTNNPINEPTFSTTILLKEYDGKKPRYSFKMAPQRFSSATPLVKNVLSWINRTSECTDDTLMRVRISFDTRMLNSIDTIPLMDTDKLILKLDESYVYDRFPEQRNSPYAMSISRIPKILDSAFSISIAKRKDSILNTPSEHYYGINLSDTKYGILEYNYIGGPDYASKQREVMEMLEFYVIKTYQSLSEKFYTVDEMRTLNEISRKFVESQYSFDNPSEFLKSHPHIKVTANLDPREQALITFWPILRRQLFRLIVNNGLSEGDVNYDSDLSRFQVRGANLSGNDINNIDIVNCDVQGVINNCNIYESRISKSRVINSKMISGNEVIKSYIANVVADSNNSINESLVDNSGEIVNCTITKSVIRFASIGAAASIDDSVIIDKDTPRISMSDGVQVEEMRDYRWISSMRKGGDDGFQNAYIKPKIKI